MKLVVKDFGAIKKRSEIDLDKRFYVFVGYNNSGKTYMSQLMWAVYRDLEDFADYLSKIEEINHFFEINKQTIRQTAIRLEISKDLLNIISKNYHIFSKGVFSFLPVSFDNVSIIFSEEDFEKIVTAQNTLYISAIQYYDIVKDKNKAQIDCYRKARIDTISEEELKKIREHILLFLLNLVFDTYLINNTYIPSYRTFLPSYYKYIYSVAKEENELISKKLNNGHPDLEAIKELSSRPYSEAVDEILKKMQNLDKAKPANYYPSFIRDLQEIMQGDISFRQSEGIAPIRFGFQTENGVNLDMHNASSSVNQLTLLYLYFKYWAAEKNNFLIIDEPEENLHPENQIKLLNLLVKFANMNNNRVLITTHSPLVAEVVNNHAHISLLKERGENIAEIIKEHGLEITESNELKHDDYAVYFFDGEQIKNYPMNEYGAFFKDFKAAEEKVKNTANVLKNYIYESSKETAG